MSPCPNWYIVTDILKGNTQSAKGFIFCYKKDYIPGKYKRSTNKVDPTIILQFEKDGTFLKEWNSLSEAAEFLTGNRRRGSEISENCRGKRKLAFGYKWKYKNKKL